MHRLLTLLSAVILLVAVSVAAPGDKWTLHPSGFGVDSQAAWKAQEGRADAQGNANQALYFKKMTETATFAAGIAVVNGVEGLAVNALTALTWDRRTDGHCGAGAPRWNVGITGASGAQFTLFLGCAAATHTATDDAAWITDSYAGDAIVDIGGANAGLTPEQIADAKAGTIRSLAIVFDEGTDQGPGFVVLDNITINQKVWDSASANAK
jgi:hypothetical protein